jgi:hypothetical protein
MDSDSELSVGLSPEEEEQLLIDLAAKFPAFHKAPTNALDALPERVEHVVRDDATAAGAESPPLGNAAVGTDAQKSLAVAVTVQLPPPGGEVVYPNSLSG